MASSTQLLSDRHDQQKRKCGCVCACMRAVCMCVCVRVYLASPFLLLHGEENIKFSLESRLSVVGFICSFRAQGYGMFSSEHNGIQYMCYCKMLESVTHE